MARINLSLTDRLLLSKEYTAWAHDKSIPINPSTLIAWLDMWEFFDSDRVVEHLRKRKEKIDNE